MTSMSLMPPGAPEWTVDDLARMPDDGLQYELLDGLTPSVEALAQVAGAYRTVGLATGPERVELTAPFPVSLVPADLVAAPRTRR